MDEANVLTDSNDNTILGQLMAAQTVLYTLPNPARIGQFVARVLESLPNVKTCAVCIYGQRKPFGRMQVDCPEICRKPVPSLDQPAVPHICLPDKSEQAIKFSLATEQLCFGQIFIATDNPKKFETYKPFISNFANLTAIVIENQWHEDLLISANEELTKHKNALEDQVEARTSELAAANQQQTANEQQLRASNQQLLASEQQLRASNKQLQKSEEQYRMLVEGTEIFVTRVDSQGKFIFVNQASEKIYGLKPDECVGLTAFDFIHSDDRDRTKDAFDGWIRDRTENITIENRQVSRTGEVRDMLWTCKLMFDESGEVVGIDGIAKDITDRKLVERERERLVKTLKFKNKELQDIVYSASHDLRSPLVNIEGFSSILKTDCGHLMELLAEQIAGQDKTEQIEALLKEDIPESLGFITGSTKKMASLLDGLLQVSRVGSVEMDIDSIDMDNAVSGVLAAMEHQINESGASVTVDSLDGCKGDVHMMDHVLTNLIGNAIKYLDPARKGEIRISGEVKDGMSVYCIADNGIGIAVGHQGKVFEIFHRLDPEGSVGGEGLGLTIVTRIVDRLGGSIRLESEPDKGSKFFVSLPMVKA